MCKKSVSIIFLLFISFSAAARENILVYAGPGAGPKSIANTVAVLELLTADNYNIVTVGPETLLEQEWLKNTALLVMPGGADRPYLAKLQGQGNANIQRYVANGGKFLGICAGAYYSADRIEFAKGDSELEVTGERELKFFPGLVSGPTYGGYDHRDTSLYKGTRAAQLVWQLEQPFASKQEFYIFYNGGGSFIDAEKYPSVVILARYKQGPAAIVECTVGKGKAILSGPHFEWDPQTLDTSSPYLQRIKPQLVAANAARISLAKHLLSRLDLKL